MKLYYFRDAVANFGDELNPWLFSRLIPDLLDDDASELFLGIGSILFDNYPPRQRKIVFGSGYGGYRPPPILDETWTTYFVRGPRTASALGIDRSYGLGDGATLLRVLGDALPARGPALGPVFMPHWESALDGVWDRVAAEAGLGYVDPRWSVERVIGAIRSSSLVVAEAMHGAIVADALRVPWVPFLPLLEKHRPKWFDWAESLDLPIVFAPSAPSSWNEWAVQRFRRDTFASRERPAQTPRPGARAVGTLSKARAYARKCNGLGGSLGRNWAVSALARAAASQPYLSRDSVISSITARMEEQLAALRRDVAKR
ncbi:MAG: polysaccharide pyruvyl transferase family protein [Candidatus Eremiobacteraeota bacterium]|nr:polysaccharide pyruvyl transferase family protein [Candidatus Eremiobacteraeota bacterium]